MCPIPDVALEPSEIIYIPESCLPSVMGASNIVSVLAGAAISVTLPGFHSALVNTKTDALTQ